MGTSRLQGFLTGTALQDQVAAVLRDHSGPDAWLAPAEIADAVGPYMLYSRDCGHEDCERLEHRRVLGIRRYTNDRLNSALKALERTGLAERLVLGPNRNSPHRWRWIGG